MMFPPDLEISDCSTTFWGSPSVCILYVCVRVICVYIYINDGSVYMYIHIGREREREKKWSRFFKHAFFHFFKKKLSKMGILFSIPSNHPYSIFRYMWVIYGGSPTLNHRFQYVSILSHCLMTG